MRREPVRRPLRLHLFERLAEGKRLGLRENVGNQQIVMPSERIQRAAKGDEVARDEFRALVNQLIEGMLAVGARLAPENRPGLIINMPAVERDVFAVRFHRELLQVGRKALQVLLVRKDADSLRAEEIVVPDR